MLNINNEDGIYNNIGSISSNVNRENLNIANNTVKISIRDNINENNIGRNYNNYNECENENYKQGNNNDYGSNIIINLEDKLYRINSEIKMKIIDMENKLEEMNIC